MVSLQLMLLGNTQAIRSVSYQSRAGLISLLGKYTYLILRKCISYKSKFVPLNEQHIYQEWSQ